MSLQLAEAKSLWVSTEKLYSNRGRGEPGNQLDTPRGTRVFFGFSPDRVPKNKIIGYVCLQVPGYDSVVRSVRFANNEMDKVNLPVPGKGGPESYDHAYLIFDRTGHNIDNKALFRLTVTDEDGLRARQDSSVHAVNCFMASGRKYGMLF
ncbi:hypothetical protein [Nocardiopsis sp. NRRL B-16309]|uniref:hypothetical protein n=1 Tax=Nocardiopsis sp. NRRL B-16309 TaxID=1519494 RepID=UPI0012E24F5D|nr:hypothetical protein [Nocardiopsis sp. NRRL B-16309]